MFWGNGFWSALPCHITLSHFLLPAPLTCVQFMFWGNGSWSASARGNSVKGHQSGENAVRFSSDGAVVTWQLPHLTIKGEWDCFFYSSSIRPSFVPRGCMGWGAWQLLHLTINVD